MSEYTAYYQAISTGYWADEDAERCPCHGGGWFLSQVDTWHRCPIHGFDKIHPELLWDENDEPIEPGAYARPEQLPEIEWGDDDIPF